MTVSELLMRLRQAGVAVRAHGGELRVTASEGTLTAEMRREIAQHKREILDFLRDAGQPVENTRLIERVRDDQRTLPLPLSALQQAFWLAEQLNPGMAGFNMPLSFALWGRFDQSMFEYAFTQLVHRHETLRTRFHPRDGEPAQVIDEPSAFPLNLRDLSTLPPGERQDELRRELAAHAQAPFNLEQGPCMRVRVWRMSNAEHAIQITLHHLVCDAWSVGNLLRDLSEFCAAFRDGRTPRLPELKVRYADFAAWQRRWLESAECRKGIAFWKSYLEGAPACLELPTDRPRRLAPSAPGAHMHRLIPPATTARLHALARQEGVTLYMTLLAGFFALLSRYSGQNDIVVGTPAANRDRVELEPMVGLFVNVLPVRAQLTGEMSFRELLRLVRQSALQAFAHREIPFDTLLREINPPRTPEHSPFFQVLFVLQNTATAELDLPGLTVRNLPVAASSAQYALSIIAEERGGALELTLEYSTEQFEDATAERLLAHYERLLESALTDPQQPFAALEILDADEREQVLVRLNATEQPCPRDRCIHHLFEEQVARSPDAVAASCGSARLTYAELDALANQLARRLQRLGVGPDKFVAICVDPTLDLLIGVLGVLKAGGAYVPLAPEYPKERLAAMLADAEPIVLLTQHHLLPQLPATRTPLLCLDADWPDVTATDEPAPAAFVGPEHLAYMIYTSGSTGEPKGVLIEHRSLVNYIGAVGRTCALGPGDRMVQFASISFDVSVEEIFLCLTSGARLILGRERVAPIPSDLLVACRREGVTVLDLPTAYWHDLVRDMADHALALPETVRLVLIGGERARPDRFALWRKHAGDSVRLLNIYGPTETTIGATSIELTAAALRPNGGELPIGRPVANTQAYVLDSRGQPTPIGVPGELCIGGPQVARGYHRRPELTAEKFIRDPFLPGPGARVYRTGDRARWLPDGTLEFLGRLDDQVKIRGFRIELGEIETALCRQPGVKEAAVVAREFPAGSGLSLVAYIVPSNANGAMDPSALRTRLAEFLPAYMLPATFVSLAALPITPSGKIDRRALPAPSSINGDGDGAAQEPRTATERMVTTIWCDLLRLSRIGPDEDFFVLGGHSLLAMEAISRLRQATGLNVPLRALFEAPTVARISRVIEDLSSPRAALAASPIETSQSGYEHGII